MLETVHTIPRTTALPQFFTLTFPDWFPEVEAAKVLLDNFFKRMKRAFPNASALWRLEVIDRKSGSSKGQVAPHFHLLVWGGVEETWAKQAWFEVNGQSDYAHLKHGAKVDTLDSWAGAVSYCAKYCGKVCEFETHGRIWGIHNRKEFPAQKEPTISQEVSERERDVMARTMRRLHRSRCITAAMRYEASGVAVKARASWAASRRKSRSLTVFTTSPRDWCRWLLMVAENGY